MYSKTLFVIAKNWEKIIYPSSGEWLNKTLVHPYHDILLSTKRNELLKHGMTWMDPKRIILSENNPRKLCFI